MELKVWLPKYLKIDPNYQLVWNGEENLPIGTILQPYDSLAIQTITFQNISSIPQNYRLIYSQGSVIWLSIIRNSAIEDATFMPTFINSTMALILRKSPKKDMTVSMFNPQPFGKPKNTGKIFIDGIFCLLLWKLRVLYLCKKHLLIELRILFQ